jgi:CDP-glycerol glycerophosphotransferase (TagB/SpsB family)
MKRLLIFAAYFPNGKVDKPTTYLFNKISEVCDYSILIADSPIETQFIDTFKVDHLECNRHEEYDFGSWKRGFFWAKERGILEEYDEIIFANDSIIGPVGDINDYIASKEQDGNPPFYGITINDFGYKDIKSLGNSIYSPHIQTYFFSVTKEIFREKYFENFFRSVKKEDHKIKIVINYEMGLSKMIREKGYELKSMYTSPMIESHNPMSLEAMCVLKHALFLKKTVLHKLDESKVNEVFDAKKYPYKFEVKENKNKTLALVSMSECDDFYLVYLISDFKHENLRMLISTERQQIFVKETHEVSYIAEGLKDHYKFFDKHSFFFKLPKKYLGRDISFGVPLRSVLVNVLPYKMCTEWCTRIENNKLLFRSRDQHIKEVLASNNYTKEDKHLLSIILKIHRNDRIYNLFSDSENLRSDSAYQMFKESQSLNNYYLVDKRLPDDPENIIERNSMKHVLLFCAAKNIVTSFYYKALVPNQIKDIHQSLLEHKFTYVPHGITAGHNDSVEVSKIGGTTADQILCCSEYEKENFTRLGHKNVVVSGYPRMDKWANNTELKDQVILFFTWRKSLHNSDLIDFVRSTYVDTISKIINSIDKPIYFFPHNAIAKNKVDALKAKFKDKVIFVENTDADKFNQVFNESKYLITDISSVGWDFYYYKNRYALFYQDPQFIEGHYRPTQSFTELCTGKIVNSIEDIKEYLRTANTKPESDFFKYTDNQNTKRALEQLWQS